MTLIKFRNEGKLSDQFPFIPTVFGDFFNDFLNSNVPARESYSYVPAVNIVERADHFAIELAAPGVNKEDIKVEVENGVLTISAEKKEEKKEENERYTRKEFSFSSFRRSFSLPEHVEADHIVAAHKDGVLSLTLPKKEAARQKPVKEIRIS
jgi:HSP20 family protein